jgi:RNA polymerase sigma-70 factor (ECF subfamily)
MRHLPDAELIRLVREGSREAASALFERYWLLAWRSAYGVLGDRALAEDAAQDAVERAFGALERFDESRPFGPWLKRIAVNLAIDHLRRNRRTTLEDDFATLTAWSFGEAADEDVELLAVAEAVAQLGMAKRMVIVLRYWLDLPLEEIAGVLGLPVGTVSSRLHRAVADLQSALEEDNVF